MQGLFSIDSKFMQVLSRIYDIAVLNMLYLLTCLPIFTIGAATSALYAVCFRMGTDREEGILKTYFRSFRTNFLQGTGLFLLLFVGELLCLLAIRILLPQRGWMSMVSYLWIVLLVLLSFLYSYAFPLQSQFCNSVGQTLKNALLLSVGFLPRTILVCLVNALPLGVMVLAPDVGLRIGYVWFFFYFSAAAYVNSRILQKVFALYTKQEDNPQNHE